MRPWTETDVQILNELYLSGAPRSQVSTVLGKTIQVVDAMCEELGIDLKSGYGWSDEDVEAMRYLVGKGSTVDEVAKALGRSASAVRQAAKRYGVEIRCCGSDVRHPIRYYIPWTPDDDELLREYHSLGYSTERISELMGRTSNSISARKSMLGLRCRRDKRAG